MLPKNLETQRKRSQGKADKGNKDIVFIQTLQNPLYKNEVEFQNCYNCQT